MYPSSLPQKVVSVLGESKIKEINSKPLLKSEYTGVCKFPPRNKVLHETVSDKVLCMLGA